SPAVKPFPRSRLARTPRPTVLRFPLPATPRHQVGQRRPPIVAPHERGTLHVADAADARDTPPGKLRRQLVLALTRRRQTNGRDLTANQFGVAQDVVEVRGALNVDESVETGELEARVGLVYHGPRSRAFAGPELRVGGSRGAHAVELALEREGRGFVDEQFATGKFRLLAREFLREHGRELAGVNRASILDVERVRRKAALLVPCGDVLRRAAGGPAGTRAGQYFAGDIAEARAVPVSQKACARRQSPPDGVERLVRAGGGDTVRFGEEGGLEVRAAAGPRGEFQARAELGVGFVNRMGEQARNQGGTLGALDELG